MFKIKKDVFHVTRGDEGTFDFGLDNYVFQPEDVVALKVYKADCLNEPPVMTYEVTVEEESETIEMTLTSEKTKFGEMVNEPVDYWYEIELNGKHTPFCYDEKGPKIFKLYPEGADANVTGKEQLNG